MRIVYIHQYYCNLDMPGGTRSYELARRLVANGHRVDVLTTDRARHRRGLGWRRTDDDGIAVHWLGVPYSNHMPYGRRMVAFAEFAAAATVRAARLDADVVLATSTPLTVAVPGVLAARLRRTPFVFEVRDLWPEIPIDMGALRGPLARRAAWALARFAYRNADEIVALSPGMADGVRAVHPAARTTVVPNASDLALFAGREVAARRLRERDPWLGDRPLVVYAGTVGIANDVRWLVRLAGRVRALDPDVRFLIVGDGKQWTATRDLAAELGVLDETLRMQRQVPKAQVPDLLAAATVAASVFLPLPSLRDNSANKFFDALAAGRPVALNYGGWQAELLGRTGAGVVLDHDDLELAAKALVERLRDAEWLRRAGAAATGLAVQEFARDVLFDRFEQVLVRAARSRAVAGRVLRGTA
jgi:glycosyltransferase involved in cell wall biosynthesis